MHFGQNLVGRYQLRPSVFLDMISDASGPNERVYLKIRKQHCAYKPWAPR
jgi:hypothetical protein